MDKKSLVSSLAVLALIWAAIFFLVSFATSYWFDYDEVNFGLWESCSCTWDHSYVESYHGATRAFQIISMTCYPVSAIFCVAYHRSYMSVRAIVYQLLLGVAVVSHFLSVMVFGMSKSPDTSWSFALTVTALAICTLGLALIIMGKRLHETHETSLVRCGIPALVLAFMFFLVGFATSHWYDDNVINFGLWESCHCKTFGPYDTERQHDVTQACQIISMLCYPTSAILCAYLDRTSVSLKTILFVVSLGSAVVSHVVSLIAFSRKSKLYETGWSFALSVVAVTLCLLGLVLAIVGKNCRKIHDQRHNNLAIPDADVDRPAPEMQNRQGEPYSPPEYTVGNNQTVIPMNQLSSVPSLDLPSVSDRFDGHNAGVRSVDRPVVPSALHTEEAPPPSYDEAMAGQTHEGPVAIL